MPEQPWQGDACSLVDAFRAGVHTPVEELEATLAAIDASTLNAFCFLDVESARAAAAAADVQRPFGGVPIGVKELDHVEGWPATHASVPFAGERSTFTSTMVQRIAEHGGTIPVGLTTASEFGGVNVSRSLLHGVTHNPWQHGMTAGGSSGGSSAAVAGGLVTMATGGDGGGSIRIPAGFNGLVGLKATFGRIPRGPQLRYGNLTVTTGCVTRSVRDTARWFDVTNGHDPRDPLSLPAVGGWESGLGSHLEALRGRRVAVVADWGGAVVSPAMWDVLLAAADDLISDAGLRRVDGVDTSLPTMGAAWSLSGTLANHAALGDRWPACAGDLTYEIAAGLRLLEDRYSIEARAKIEGRRMAVNERMAAIFDEVDLVIAASNPDIAFPADGPMPKTFGGIEAGRENNGRLTFPANLYGNPAIAIPSGTVDGLPVSLQVNARHFEEPLLLDLAWLAERERPWPLTAPGAPH
jgi:aspartyl-tRNA(Asn)/glutamyl-tRNA(Gln) amidotransferase subunit A